MITFTSYILISVALATGFDIEGRNSTAATVTTNFIFEDSESVNVPNFLVRLLAVLDDSKIPLYLTDLILNEPSKLNISSEDIISLFDIKYINISEARRILDNFNVSSSAVFSIEGFDAFLTELKLDFVTTYTNIVDEMNLTPADQLTFLDSLGINAMEFSFAFQFGNPYIEFRKGNFSNDLFVQAVKNINRTTEEVFNVCRNQFMSEILKLSAEQNFIILGKYGITVNKLKNLWNLLNVSMEKPHKIPIFRDLLHNITQDINLNFPLGILTRDNQLSTNNAVVGLFEGKPIQVNASRFDNSTVWSVSDVLNSSMPNIMVLLLENTQLSADNDSFAILGKTTEDLENCTFISVDSNGTIGTELVYKIINDGDILRFNSTKFLTNVSKGSPLVCSTKVYGLASKVSSGVVVLDSFATRENFDNEIPDGNRPEGDIPDEIKPIDKPDDNKPDDDKPDDDKPDDNKPDDDKPDDSNQDDSIPDDHKPDGDEPEDNRPDDDDSDDSMLQESNATIILGSRVLFLVLHLSRYLLT